MNAKTELLRAREVAARLNVSRSAAYALMANGTLPVIKLGPRSIRVPRRALDSWIEARTLASSCPDAGMDR